MNSSMPLSVAREPCMAELAGETVEVVYALPERQSLVSLRLRPGMTARDAVLEAQLEHDWPELDVEHCPLGIFGKLIHDDHALRAGDRVEIYRPLPNDPREQRRALAARGEVMGRQKPG